MKSIEIPQRHTIIILITTDDGSNTLRGAESRPFPDSGRVVYALSDTCHQAQTQKKATDVMQMFPKRTTADIQSTKRKFSVDSIRRYTY